MAGLSDSDESLRERGSLSFSGCHLVATSAKLGVTSVFEPDQVKSNQAIVSPDKKPKTRKSWNKPGQSHYLTFSTYHRKPYLKINKICQLLMLASIKTTGRLRERPFTLNYFAG